MRNQTHHYSVERERIEALARLIAAIAVTCVVWVTDSSSLDASALQQTLIRYGALMYVFGAICLATDLWLQPTRSVSRNFLSIILDVSAVSGGLYLGAGTVDPVALFYLWIMLGSGVVYGISYLYFAGALSLIAFGCVFLISDYWNSQPMFSATVAGLMLGLGPYLASLLLSLERTRDLVTWQADHDSLTDLLNRRAFEREIEHLVPAENSDHEHFLLYLDLDKFKAINDSAGHTAGDQALTDFAQLLTMHAQTSDLVARMGGDEFCLLLLNRSLEDARRCAEDIRNEVASYRLAWGTSYYELGVSVGVASSLSVADSQAMIRLADAACYASKNNGRNQVHVVDTVTDIEDTQSIRKLVLPGRN